MMPEYSVEASESAEKDLRDIVRYISAELEAPITAIKMMDTYDASLYAISVFASQLVFCF